MKKVLAAILRLVCMVALVWGTALASNGQEKQPADNEGLDENAGAVGFPNLPFPTLGGKQFWTDYQWKSGWRLQQNAVTKHWRLIDNQNIRRAWGNRAACEQRLAQIECTASEAQRVYILIHGLGRSASSMKPLAEALQAYDSDSLQLAFEYASTREEVKVHAQAFRSLVEKLPEDIELRLVGHSLGNIVVRHALADWQREGRDDVLNRVDRIVMLGPPNQGSSIAKRLAKLGAFQLLTGASGQELGAEWAEFQKRLATPTCPFGIIAGRIESRLGQNPLVDGKGDFVVSVEETKLEGATDFLEVPQLHTFLMDDEAVQAAVVSFYGFGQVLILGRSQRLGDQESTGKQRECRQTRNF